MPAMVSNLAQVIQPAQILQPVQAVQIVPVMILAMPITGFALQPTYSLPIFQQPNNMLMPMAYQPSAVNTAFVV